MDREADISRKRADAGRLGGLKQKGSKDSSKSESKPKANIEDEDEDNSSLIFLNKNLKGVNPEDVRLVQLLIDLMVRNNPDSSIIKRLTPDRQAEWIRQCRLLRESDKKKIEDIETVIRFSQDDKFWQSNILSMSKLREKFDQLWLKARGADPHAGIKEWLKDEEKKDAGKE
jgi:hypothetical protein